LNNYQRVDDRLESQQRKCRVRNKAFLENFSTPPLIDSENNGAVGVTDLLDSVDSRNLYVFVLWYSTRVDVISRDYLTQVTSHLDFTFDASHLASCLAVSHIPSRSLVRVTNEKGIAMTVMYCTAM
jgi:hypothetical protein